MIARDLSLPSGRLHALEWGPEDGPLLLCAHGLSANAMSFAPFAAHLAGQGHRVVALDLRGRGRSEVTPPGTYGLVAHADDVLAAGEALGAARFDLAGWSMGALIGLVVAAQAPERVRSLLLIDHAGGMDEAAVDAVRAGLARLDAVVPSPEVYVEAIRAASPIARWSEDWEAFYRYELAQRDDGSWTPTTDRAACAEDLDQATAHDWVALWRALTVPTALLRCAEPLNGGFIVPEDVRDAFAAAVPAATVVEVPANHFDVMTDPATITAAEQLLATPA